jgi:hypothetical protein
MIHTILSFTLSFLIGQFGHVNFSRKAFLHSIVIDSIISITYSWEGDISDCYPEINIVNWGEAEVDNVFSKGNNIQLWPLLVVDIQICHNCFIIFLQNKRKIYFMYSILYMYPMVNNGLTLFLFFIHVMPWETTLFFLELKQHINNFLILA